MLTCTELTGLTSFTVPETVMVPATVEPGAGPVIASVGVAALIPASR